MNTVQPKSTTVGVIQREWGITNSSSSTPCIGTTSVGNCIAMIVYSPRFKEAALAHLDNATATMENVNKLFQSMAEKPGAFQIIFAGGWKGHNTKVEKFIVSELMPHIKKSYGYPINTKWLLKMPFMKGYDFVGIDTRDGTMIVKEEGELVFQNAEEMAKKSHELCAELFKPGQKDLAGPVDTRNKELHVVIPEYSKELLNQFWKDQEKSTS